MIRIVAAMCIAICACTNASDTDQECSEETDPMRVKIIHVDNLILQPAALNTWASATVLTSGPEQCASSPGLSLSVEAVPANRAAVQPLTDIWAYALWSRNGSASCFIVFDAIPGGLVSVPADQVTINGLSRANTPLSGAYRFSANIAHSYDAYVAPMSLTYSFTVAAGQTFQPGLPPFLDAHNYALPTIVPPFATEVTINNFSAAAAGLFRLIDIDGFAITLEAPIPGSILAGAKSTFKLGGSDRYFAVVNNTLGTITGQVSFRLSL